MILKRHASKYINCLFISIFITFFNTPNKSMAEDMPKGEAIVTIFSDFHTGLTKSNNDKGFGLERAYVGYKQKFNGNWEVKAVIDFGQSEQVEDHHRIGFIKNAQAAWKKGKWEINGGLISTTQFKLQEDFWGKRYIMKSFQDEYKYGSSADLGFSVKYSFSPMLAMDFILVNGEGYKKVQLGKGLLYGIGITLNPISNMIFRIYGSYNEAERLEEKGIGNLAVFLGYSNHYLSIAGEYNLMLNKAYIKDSNENGGSFYFSLFPKHKISYFGRCDFLKTLNQPQEIKEINFILGTSFKLNKHIKLSPNLRLKSNNHSSVNNKTLSLFLNVAFVI